MNPIYKKKNSSILNVFFNSTVFIIYCNVLVFGFGTKYIWLVQNLIKLLQIIKKTDSQVY